MNANIGLILFLILAGFSIFWLLRKPPPQASAPNSMVRLRQRRASMLKPEKQTMPDVAKVHEHDKKMKNAEAAEVPLDFESFKLLQDPSEDVIKRIRRKVSNIRKPHPLLLALCRKTSEPKELYDIIRKDPELVAKVINVANSPLFGLSKPITNLNHAIVFLGLVQVKSIATHFALQETISFESEMQRAAYERIWSAGFLASCIALELAKDLGLDSGAELSTRCQLSYLGDLAVIVDDPETSGLYAADVSLLERTKAIQHSSSTNQAVISGILAKQWNLPKQIIDNLALNLLPFTNSALESVSGEKEQIDTLLCYISCRIADIIAFNKDIDVLDCEALDWASTGRIEFYHTSEQLERLGLSRIHQVVANTGFKRKVNQFLQELSI